MKEAATEAASFIWVAAARLIASCYRPSRSRGAQANQYTGNDADVERACQECVSTAVQKCCIFATVGTTTFPSYLKKCA
jgi:hypothetical protein